MLKTEQQVLDFIKFSQTSDWNIKQIVSQVFFSSKYDKVSIGKCIKRIKNEVAVQNDVLYKRLTIKTKGGGVFVRDELLGQGIKTKNQYLVSSGQLAVSKIDARNGAFGIVPGEANGAIITGNFWVFDVDVNRVFPQFLVLLLSSDQFVQAWLECSNGSGNRLYLQEEKFLKYMIPLPSIEEQQVLLDKYNAGMKKADEAEHQAQILNNDIDGYILEYTNCPPIENMPMSSSLLKVKAFSKMLNWGAQLNANAVSPKELFLSKQYKNVALSAISEVNPTTTYSEELANKSITFLPMECISDVYGEIADKRCGRISDSKGYTRFQENDILWAKITPCMQNGKCAVARGLENGYGYGSTEYHVIRANADKVLPEYLYCFLRTQLVRKVAQTYFSGSAGQQRVGADFLENLNIPLILIRSDDQSQMTQEKMVKQVFEVKAEIKALRGEAESLRQRAKKEFEEAVFGGV